MKLKQNSLIASNVRHVLVVILRHNVHIYQSLRIPPTESYVLSMYNIIKRP